MFPIFASMTNYVDAAIISAMTSAIVGGIAFTSQYIRIAFSIYVIGYGMMLMYGKGHIDVWVSAIIRALIITALLQASNFNYYVEQLFFTDLPNAFAQALGGPGINLGSAQQFDVLWSAALNATAKVTAAASDSWFGPMYRIAAYAMAGLMFIALLVSWIIWYSSRFFMAVEICLVPFFLMLFLFKRTEGWGYSLIGKIVGFCALELSAAIVLRIVLHIITQQMLAMQPQLQGGVDIMLVVLLCITGMYWMGTLLMVCLPGAVAIGSGSAAGGAAASRLMSAATTAATLPLKLL